MELLNRKEKDFLRTWLSFKWIYQLLLCFTNIENVKSFEGSISPVCVLFYILAAALLVITVFFFCAAGKKRRRYNLSFTLKLQYHTSCNPLTKKRHTDLLLYPRNQKLEQRPRQNKYIAYSSL